VNSYNKKFKRRIEGISPDAARVLLGHDWPGNVRELRNAIERAMILEDSRVITPTSLPLALDHPAITAAPAPASTSGLSLYEQERRLLMEALEKTGGNQTKAAKLLDITRDTLRYKMKKFQLR